ncbi:MAG TPA: DUF6289 family protein [Streptosporangiaceae bacterium]|jgi:hypothetical protein|nr:DUF6289 family protein [Streptosporangiaceae bacterium]
MIRRILLAAAAASGSLMLFSASTAPVSASPVPAIYGCQVYRQSCTWTYYSTPFLQTIVGGRTMACDGVVTTWGQYSPYQRFAASSC